MTSDTPFAYNITPQQVSSPSHRIKRQHDEKKSLEGEEDHQKLRQRSARRQFDNSCLRDVQCRARIIADRLFDHGCSNKVSMKKKRKCGGLWGFK